MEHDHKNCCHAETSLPPRGERSSVFKTAAHATLHCLTGCMIGELASLTIGVSIGLHPYASMVLSTILAFISGFSLTVFPLMRRAILYFTASLKAIWLGE